MILMISVCVEALGLSLTGLHEVNEKTELPTHHTTLLLSF